MVWLYRFLCKYIAIFRTVFSYLLNIFININKYINKYISRDCFLGFWCINNEIWRLVSFKRIKASPVNTDQKKKNEEKETFNMILYKKRKEETICEIGWLRQLKCKMHLYTCNVARRLIFESSILRCVNRGRAVGSRASQSDRPARRIDN